MPEGLQYALSGKLSELTRISVITCDEGPSLFTHSFIQEALMNSLEVDGAKVHVHLVLFAYDVVGFHVPGHRTGDLTVYDYVRNPSPTLESLYELIVKAAASKPGKSHILVVDDYSLLSVLSSDRDSDKLSNFVRLLSSRIRKMFLFFSKGTLSTEEVTLLYHNATDIAYLQLHPDSVTGSVCDSNSMFMCELLKIRADRRVSHDRTSFRLTTDGIEEKIISNSSASKGDTNSSDVLKNLTTFKLTLEEGERETKNKLHLPYFEAQKTSLEDPENFDDFEDDEEDEEV